MPSPNDSGLEPPRITETGRPDIGQMIVMHKALGREFGLLPAVVGAVQNGDRKRARKVARHAELIIAFLHAHHDGEDQMLWPLLLQRLPLETELVQTMEQQHAVLADLITAIRGDLAQWRRTTAQEYQRTIVNNLNRLLAELQEHLFLEETEVLPLIGDHLTVAEWNAPFAYAQHHTAVKPSAGLRLVGMVLEDACPNERTWFLGHLPAVGRLAWRLIGVRQYRRYTERIRMDLATA